MKNILAAILLVSVLAGAILPAAADTRSTSNTVNNTATIVQTVTILGSINTAGPVNGTNVQGDIYIINLFASIRQGNTREIVGKVPKLKKSKN